jgi:hypothetical protein
MSPRFEPSSRYELQPPSPRGLHPRSAATNSQMRHRNASTANTLKLPGLPRFHPANFPSSQSSSVASTPSAGPLSPSNPPPSPKAQQRLYSEAQKQLYLYHRETLAAQAAVTAAASAGSGRPPSLRFEKPLSPRLAPLGSPGPVTPLELEGQDGYLMAGAAHASSAATHAAAAQEAAAQLSAQHSDLVDKLIEQEVRRTTDLDSALGNLNP